MDKKKKIIYSIVLILVVLGLVGLSFYLGTQINKFTDKPKENEQENSEKVDKTDDEETTKPEKNKNYTFAKEYEEEITLNNKKHTLLTYYYNDYKIDDNYSNNIIRKEVYLDNKALIFSGEIINYGSDNEWNPVAKRTPEEIDNFHKEFSKYYTIKDTQNQNEYLILKNLKRYNEGFAEGGEGTITIVNDNYQVLKSIKSTNPHTYIVIVPKKEAIEDRTLTIENGEQVLYGDSFADIHSTHLYYISYETNCNVEEYKVTIENGIIKETHTRTYYKGNEGNEETEYGRIVIAGDIC